MNADYSFCTFKKWQPVKVKGNSYTSTGVIVGVFSTTDYKPRYVVRLDTPDGLEHIMGENNLEAIEDTNLFSSGQTVEKYKGSYTALGVIKEVYRMKDGQYKYVFQFDSVPGLVHLFLEHQLRCPSV